MYTQCILRKKLTNSYIEQTAWLPVYLAIKGTIINIKGENGWEIISVGTTELPYEEVNERSRDHLKQRKASDI